MIRFWFIKQIKWPWNYYAGCVCRSKLFEIPSSNRSDSFHCQAHSRPALFILLWGGFFWFTAFNIVTNIVYKSINFAMCQFMRFSATHFMYSLIIDECMRMEMRTWNTTTNICWLYWYSEMYAHRCSYKKEENTNNGWCSTLMRSHINNKCCGIVLFWLFGWNNFCKCIRRYSINFMFIAYCLIILVVYT